MTPENNIFSILQSALFGTPLAVSETVDWQEVHCELMAHTVAALPAQVLGSAPTIPPELLTVWRREIRENISDFLYLFGRQEELIRLLAEHGIHGVVLKGTACALYYPNPELRTMGDIDYLVPQEQYERAYEVLIENGYALYHEKEHKDYHVALHKNGALVELHNAPHGLLHTEQDEYMRTLFAQGLTCPRQGACLGVAFPMFGTELNGLLLLLHLRAHIVDGLGIRQVVDWMMFVVHHVDDAAWHAYYCALFKKAGLLNLAIVVTRLCQLYLGLPQENFTWCATAKEWACIELKNTIMEMGNFGRKSHIGDKGRNFLANAGTPRRLFAGMQEKGHENWPLSRKNPLVYQFAWLFPAGRYLGYILTKKYSLRSLIADLRGGRKRTRMYKVLRE